MFKTSYFGYLVHTGLIEDKNVYIVDCFFVLFWTSHIKQCLYYKGHSYESNDFVFCLILTKILMWSHSLVKIPHLKMHKNLSGRIGIIPYGQTDGHTCQVK
jgi:hypothetical protein